MIDMSNTGVVRWLVDAAASAGSPDPEGLVSQMQVNRSKVNQAGVDKAAAKSVGVPDVTEPFLSFTAAVKLDKASFQGDPDALRRKSNPALAEAAIANRSNVQQQYSQALMNETPPQDPFFNEGGQLVLHRTFKNKLSLTDIDTTLGEVVDGFLNELDAEL